MKKRRVEVRKEQEEENTYLEMQLELTVMVRALGYHVWVAANDRGCSCNGVSLRSLTVMELPPLDFPSEVLRTISLIDVIWIDQKSRQIACALEIEKSTSIYSGMLRLLDLASSLAVSTTSSM